MNKSRSFDRAAHIYDQTRLLLEPIANYGIPAILELIGSDARVLEVGCGTGRISIPLLERGVDWTGCDLSSQMLARFRDKFPQARMTQADATHLPYSDADFDAVLTVHVLHLIPAWRDVLREFQRVLVPGGTYLNVRTWASVGISVAEQIRQFWRGWLAANGFEAGHPGLRSDADLLQQLQSMGATVTEVEAVRFRDSFYLSEEMNRFEAHVYSDTWDIPEPLFNASVKELRAWMMHEFGSLDREITDEVRVIIQAAQFER